MDQVVLKFLNKKGYKNVELDYYEYIEDWEKFWKNDLDFHKYKDYYGKERTMYSLGLAKRICEDWGSILWSDRDTITSDNELNKESLDETFDDFDLANNIPKVVEIASAYGTCGGIVRIKNGILKGKTLTADKNTIKEFILLNAKQIVPLRKEHGNIVDCAFVSTTQVNKKDCYYIEIHVKEEDGYTISNNYILKSTGKPVENDATLNEYFIPGNTPLFSLLMPPKVNPIKKNNSLGFSIFGDAIDQIKACDIAFNNFVMDFYLGGKKIIYNKSLIKYKQKKKIDSDGNETIEDVPIYPDDISKQQFMEVGDDTNINDKELIHEYNPELRTEENKEGIQFFLDIASFKSMLGQKYYQLNGGNITTATQYVGERQDLVINAKKYRDRLSKFISEIMKASLLLDRLIFNKKVTENCDIIIENVDGFMIDQETMKAEARKDLAQGVISKVEYRMKIFHEDEETAKRKIEDINKQYEITSIEGD